MYDHLFSPLTINKTEIKNRIAYPSLGTLFSYEGKPNDKHINFFREKARGGAGLVTVGPVGFDELGSGLLTLLLRTDDDIPGMRRLSAAIQEEGARAWVQLYHAGAYSNPLLINGKTPMAPSAVYSKFSKTTPFEMTTEDVKQVQEDFAAGALRVKEAGYDGVEIIGSAGYLIPQFLSPLTNQRTDEYGGSFENRTRFPREVIELIRRRVGPDFPVTIRMAGNDFVPGSNTDEEMPAIARIYEAAGIDAINVTGGWHETRVPQMTPHVPRAGYAYLAGNIKEAVSVPIFASNRIMYPDIAEQLIRDGLADMINLGRELITDPYWPTKAREGRANEIRPCVACLQGCMDSIMSGKPLFCVCNPRAGFEGERVLETTNTPKKVMVVGAGLAGLEAAVTAAAIGHTVELYDKAPVIGGQTNIAAMPPGKQEQRELLRYYRVMLKKHGLTPKLSTEVDPALIKERQPDYLIIAEGAKPLVPPIKGVDDPAVRDAWDVLRDNPRLGKRVAVIGGGAVGLETALFIASKGTINADTLHFLFSYEAESTERLRELIFQGTHEVTVFEMLPKAGQDVGKSTKWVLLGEVQKYGIVVNTTSKVVAIEGGRVTVEKDGQQQQLDFDEVVLAAGSAPVRTLSEKVAELGIPYTTVGDCVQPGKINDAVHGGYMAAVNIS